MLAVRRCTVKTGYRQRRAAGQHAVSGGFIAIYMAWRTEALVGLRRPGNAEGMYGRSPRDSVERIRDLPIVTDRGSDDSGNAQ